MPRRILSLCLIFLLFAGSAFSEERSPKDRAVEYLLNRLYDGIDCLAVYSDSSAAENHFPMRSKIDDGQPHYVYDMIENWSDNPYSGDTCIRCAVNKVDINWGGWLFLNGYLTDGSSEPKINYGDVPSANYDLSGAKELSFRARGARGGEMVEFFTGGYGYDANGQFPERNDRVSLGYVNLTDEWEEYIIPLTNKSMDSVLCGFGFICTGIFASGEHVFYLDDIHFHGLTDRNMQYPRFVQSYEANTARRPDELYLQNAAFSYDNALVAMALLSENRQEDAKRILDAFAYAIAHDRAEGSRVRNAYAYGSVEPRPGWGDTVSLSGVYDADQQLYIEDAYQIGTSPGNTAFVALAFLQYDRLYGAPDYVELTRAVIDAVLEGCADEYAGFTAGADGEPGDAQPLTHKSIEHNLDLYAVCKRLHAITGDARYEEAAANALRLIENLYDAGRNCFLIGTETDGVTAVIDPIALDAQFWAALALDEAFAPYTACIQTAIGLQTDDGLYPFSDAESDGGWLEGTAFAALALQSHGETGAAAAAIDALEAHQLESGGFPAASAEEHFTGLYLSSGAAWNYTDTPHIAPAAWYVLAANGFNPFAFEE